MLVSGTSRRWTQHRVVENINLGHVATLDSNVVSLKTYVSTMSRRWNASRERRDVEKSSLSITSQCWPERHDVEIKTLRNVTTLAQTSRHCPVFRPRNVSYSPLCPFANPSVLSTFFKNSSQIPSQALPKVFLAILSNLQSPRSVPALKKNPIPLSFRDLAYGPLFISVQVLVLLHSPCFRWFVSKKVS